MTENFHQGKIDFAKQYFRSSRESMLVLFWSEKVSNVYTSFKKRKAQPIFPAYLYFYDPDSIGI